MLIKAIFSNISIREIHIYISSSDLCIKRGSMPWYSIEPLLYIVIEYLINAWITSIALFIGVCPPLCILPVAYGKQQISIHSK